MEITAIKLALLAQQIREKSESGAYIHSEPIAIVGLGCRFPGGANSPQAYWNMLREGKDAICEIPADRWDINALYDPSPDVPGKMNTRFGGFLDRAQDTFDAAFFGLSPRETSRMDPQQRLVLEVAYEALEDAGQTRDSLSGTPTGVFVASYHNDYSQILNQDLNQIDAYSSTGTAHSIVANRLSYLLNLHGPSMAVDTACSSSLVAAHLACQSLRDGECDLAVAGGVSLMITPEVTISLTKWGFMAPDGRCKTFDARADGFVRGEGCGMVVLKRLSDALADGDRIYALIRGTAVNQDGRSTVLTAPNGLAQQMVIRKAIENAHIAPTDVTYVETHGTGTSLGDPIEVDALTATYGKLHPDGSDCVLASVKTNIGHLEAAAGMAGLIKVVLCMQNNLIPRHLHFQKLNPHITLEGTPFVIPVQEYPWPAGDRPRLAGASGFGFGGTNAHIILEETPVAREPAPALEVQRPFVLPISAHTPEALRDLARSYQAFLANPQQTSLLADICYTASHKRTHYEYRAAVSGETPQELSERMGWIADGNPRPGAALGSNPPGLTGKLAFVFSGQGPQWWGMGRSLMESEPVYRQTIEQVDSLLRPLAGWSLAEELNRPEAESRLDQTEIAQPAIFALQVALAALWQSWGVAPQAVVGHSVGEIAAAYCAGVLTLDEAVRVVYHRARLMQRATGLGKMAAVELSAEETMQEIARLGLSQRIAVAAINAPASVTISGEEEALEEALRTFEQRGISTRRLRVNYAFHSPQMETFRLELTQVLENVATHPAEKLLVSTLSGKPVQPGDYDAEYWGWNIRQPVQFAAAVGTLIQQGFTTFLEVSPHTVLASSLTQCLEFAEKTGAVVASLRRGQPEEQTLGNALAELYANHINPDWDACSPEGQVVSLPLFPWQRQRYWFEPKTAAQVPVLADITGAHPLLGQKLLSPAVKGTLYQAAYSAAFPAFLADHRIYDHVVVPGTAYLEMALAACAQQFGDQPCAVEDFAIHEALLLPEGETRVVQFIASEGKQEFEIYSRELSADTWKQHASGRLAELAEPLPRPPSSLEQCRSECSERLPVDTFFQRLDDLGIHFGQAFLGLSEIWRTPDCRQTLARIQPPSSIEDELQQFRLHPALLDACFQTLGATFVVESGNDQAWLPFGVDSFAVDHVAQGEWWCHAVLRPGSPDEDLAKGDLYIFNDTGALFAVLTGLTLRRASRSALQHALKQTALQNALYTLSWQPEALPVSGKQLTGCTLILGDTTGVGQALGGMLETKPVYITANAATAQTDSDTYHLDPSAPADFQRVLQELHGEQPVSSAVYLWNLDKNGAQAWDNGLQGMLHLVQALAKLENPPRLFVVTHGAQAWLNASPRVAQSTAWGLGRTVQLEHPELRCVLVDLDPAALPATNARWLMAELNDSSAEDQVLYRNETRYAARLSPRHAVKTDAPVVHLHVTSPGVLENLQLVPSQRRTPAAGEVEIRVYATGVNFRDVLNTLGMYPGANVPLGGECAGVISAVGAGVIGFKVGDAVLGIAMDSFATYTLADARLVVRKPSELTFAEAASIPSVYLTAWYGLHHLAQIQPGQRVLIHAAAGGVGMAAVQLARQAGAVVFGTAGSPEKRALIAARGVDHALDSRTLAFSEQVLEFTDGQGADIILNSLAGDFITKSVECLATGGCFLEIGKRDIWTADQMAAARPEGRYFVYDMAQVFLDQPDLIHDALEDLVRSIASGELALSPVRVFPLEQAQEAFRFMAQAKHTGKLVLTQEPDAPQPVILNPEGAYLITGGLGGLGPLLAQGLVDAGARHVALMGLSEPAQPAQAAIDRLAAGGAQVHILLGDVTDADSLAHCLERFGRDLPPLRGIIHAAGMLRDGVLAQQSWEQFAPVLAPKATGVQQLQKLTRSLPLDLFVLFSSAAGVIGSPGQGNYAAANAYLDGFAQWSSAAGTPMLSISWGGWTSAGMASRLSQQDQQRFARQGLVSLEPDQGARILTDLLGSDGHVIAVPFDWDAFVRSYADRPIPPLYRNVTHAAQSKAAKETTHTVDIRKRLAEAPASKRRSLLQAHLREHAMRVLGLSASYNLDSRQPLREIGMDSLMAVELRNAISASMQQKLPATLLFDFPTIEALTDFLGPQLWQQTKAAPEPAPAVEKTPAPSAETAGVENLTDEEAEALLLAELEKSKRK